MLKATRRGFLQGAVSLGAAGYALPVHATLMRGLSLPALIARSDRIAVLEPVDAVCRYTEIGGRRCIVTDTLARLHEVWGEPADTELTLRTLGGSLDGMGELVHGQPQLELGVHGVAFLTRAHDGRVWWMTGMAQGHFPLSGSGDSSRLLANRGLPSILNLEASAVRRLVGRQLSEARELVRQARQQ